ncbi:MAG: protein translocase subunit SecD [Verrucomicrobiota bacterium]|nr:protein translocase subunit SecD [Verrucomicrobiota bacterium]
MNKSILTKIILTVVVMTWCIVSLIPIEDQPFAKFLRDSASAEKDSFSAIVARAEQKVKDNSEVYPSVYVAMRKMCVEDALDLSKYFPHLDVSDQKSVAKRNDTLLRELLRRSHSKINLGLDLKGGVSVTFGINEQQLSSQDWERAEQISKAKKILSERVDGLGVAEPIIRNKGATRIEIQMPGINTKDNPDILKTIGAPALLEFSLVARNVSPLSSPEAPLGYTRMTMEYDDPKTGKTEQIPEYVKKVPVLKGSIIKQATARPNNFGGFVIALNFTDDGAKKFAAVTRQIAEENQITNSVGRLAIILDGKLYSAPSVKEEINSGGAEISGHFTQREAIELANVLNNPLEVGLKAEEIYEVGPTLATDARSSSLMAAAISAGLTALFMIGVYQLGGVIACIALAVNVLIILGIMAMLNATLSLPGVAGLVLTIGMAVDANILIFERIREEVRAGKSLSVANLMGHDKAFSAIIDSNITTIMSGAILIWLGSGPIKGFGVTLCIGIIANLFTVLIVAHWMLDLVIEKGWVKKLFMQKTLSIPEFPFLNYRKPAFIAAGVCLLIGIVSAVVSHKDLTGIDFKGGDEISMTYSSKISTNELESIRQTNNLTELNPTYQKDLATNVERLVIQTAAGEGEKVFALLQKAHPEAGLNWLGMNQIGPAVGRELLYNALLSVAVALLGMLIYVTLRFEIGYALGAVLSLIFTVFMSLGIYIFIGQILNIGTGQFTGPMVAAVLTILGYAINDTIVVFDRVREELELDPTTKLDKVINRSLSLTLSRTLFTSSSVIASSFILAVFGADVIVDFALLFLIGVITGTFASIFIASPIFYWYHKGDRKHVEAHHLLPEYDWHTGVSNKPKEATK